MIPRNNLALPILTPSSNLLSKIGARYFGTAEAPSPDYQQSRHSLSNDDDYPTLDWSNLGFNLTPVDYMYVMKSGEGEEFKFELEEGEIRPFGNIELSPAAGILNYGQGLLEGLKAYRRDDGGICLFRPQENAIRLQIGARRMCMPSPSVAQFVEAVKQITLANKRWIPPLGKGSLYIRPLLMGTGATLGVAPAPEYTFLLYASPVGNYFKGGQLRINLYVEEDYHRATRGGVGGVKSITNYAPVMQAMISAKGRGFSDVLYLDSVNKRYVEEASASNVFIVKGNVLSTPATTGTILEGITRTTIMEIARDSGYQVEERSISIDELIDADEAFCTGTAAVIAPVGSVTYQGKRTEYKQQTSTSVSEKLHSTLTGIQRGTVEDNKGWILKIH